MSKFKNFKKKHPSLYEGIRVTFALSFLGSVLTPMFMYADANKTTNIHSLNQIGTFEKVLKIKKKSPTIYKAISSNYKIDFEYCINKLEGLDFHDSEYFKCKKIANAIQRELDSLDL